MDDSCHRETITQQDNFIIIKLCLEKNATLPMHKSKGLTTIIPIKGNGILKVNGEIHPISPGVTVNLTPNDEHLLSANTALEVLVVEIIHVDEEK